MYFCLQYIGRRELCFNICIYYIVFISFAIIDAIIFSFINESEMNSYKKDYKCNIIKKLLQIW